MSEEKEQDQNSSTQLTTVLTSNIQQSSQDKTFWDVTFFVERSNSDNKEEEEKAESLDDHEFHGSRYLFAIHSPVLKAMLYGRGKMMESDPNNRVQIEDVHPKAFQFIVDYVYSLNPQLSVSNVVKASWFFLLFFRRNFAN